MELTSKSFSCYISYTFNQQHTILHYHMYINIIFNIDFVCSWAQTTLREHWNDPRAVLYSVEELEYATTKDMLWNAAQNEMVCLMRYFMI
jgi:hypothetical protein